MICAVPISQNVAIHQLYARVRYEISTGWVFLNLKNVLCSKWKFDPLKYFPSHCILSCSQQFTDHLNAI